MLQFILILLSLLSCLIFIPYYMGKLTYWAFNMSSDTKIEFWLLGFLSTIGILFFLGLILYISAKIYILLNI